MNDIIPFQPLDLPNDIQIVSAPDFPYYIFHKISPSYYFRIYIDEIKDNEQNIQKTIVRAFKCDKNGKTDKNKESEKLRIKSQKSLKFPCSLCYVWYEISIKEVKPFKNNVANS